ncbi:hypothetical protein ElyMa_005911800 [Elysia marginata]|uniref:Uncharacterized protein n=1 Tax=Elysia marginata TaxID=1093978 RepID=A0AAV4G6L0_9GAST|nr:hypothetical protein ElyMa_005911800 [Elysia marginata]
MPKATCRRITKRNLKFGRQGIPRSRRLPFRCRCCLHDNREPTRAVIVIPLSLSATINQGLMSWAEMPRDLGPDGKSMRLCQASSAPAILTLLLTSLYTWRFHLSPLGADQMPSP